MEQRTRRVKKVMIKESLEGEFKGGDGSVLYAWSGRLTESTRMKLIQGEANRA